MSPSNVPIIQGKIRAPVTKDLSKPDKGTKIIELILSTYGISIPELHGPSRKQRVMWPRQLCCLLLRDVAQWDFARIGRAIGRDGTTAQYNRQSVLDQAAAPKVFKEVKNLLSLCNEL